MLRFSSFLAPHARQLGLRGQSGHGGSGAALHRFVTQWGKQAQALGWATADLFGLHIPPEKPAPNYRRLARYDQTGLIWLLHGRPVIALTQTAATILAPSGASLMYRRHRTLGDDIDDISGARA